MIKINPQFTTNSEGESTGVFLPIDEFRQILEELEDYEDILVFDEAENRVKKEFVDYQEAIKAMIQ